MRNFKKKEAALKYMVENPGAKGVNFCNLPTNDLQAFYYTWGHKVNGANMDIFQLAYFLPNLSSLYFRCGSSRSLSQNELTVNFTVGTIPGRALQIRPDLKEDL